MSISPRRSYYILWRILYLNLILHPNEVQITQQLKPIDHSQRRTYAILVQWMAFIPKKITLWGGPEMGLELTFLEMTMARLSLSIYGSIEMVEERI